MSVSEELKELDELRRSGVLTSEEFELAKRKVLGESKVVVNSDHLEEIKAQNEVAQLDREWELERENYMVEGRYGQRQIPGKISSVFGGILIVGFGIFWTAMAASMSSPFGRGGFDLFPLFGVLFVISGFVMCVRAFLKADQYAEAQEQYRQRRNELIDRNRLN